MDNMVWNVYYHNINKNKIEVKNIFDHGGFNNGVKEIFSKCKTKEELAEELRKELSYYFRCRAEWETTVSPYCGGSKTDGIRVDIYEQVMLNWNLFVDYVCGFMKVVKEE